MGIVISIYLIALGLNKSIDLKHLEKSLAHGLNKFYLIAVTITVTIIPFESPI